MIKIAFPTDEHFPFQNDRAREVALKIVQDFNPDELPAGSDGLDFYKLSHFDRDPARMNPFTFQEEIEMWQKAQLEWKTAAPNARRRYIMGNHEFRWNKALWKLEAFNEIADLSLSKILGLQKLGIEYNNMEEIDLGPLVIRHGQVVKQHSAASARGEVEKQRHQVSTLTGHTHRGGMYMTATRQGIVYGLEGFCLCRLDPWYGSGPYDWQNGIVLATIHDDRSLQFEPIPFSQVNGKVVAHWRDKEYLS
jgi:hypothetical protein